jgi:hypothetical protein
MYNQIAGGYQQSPGFQNNLKMAMTAGNNAAAADGMLGTNQHQFMNAQEATNLANNDFQTYMQNRLGMGDRLGSTKGQQGAYGFAGQQGMNQQHSALIGQLLQLLGIGGSYGLSKWGG